MSQRITGLVSFVFATLWVAAACGSASAAGDAQATEQSAAPSSAGSVVRVVELNTWYRAALVDRAATRNPRDLEAIARPICEGLTVCRVGIWTDEWSMPNAMPVRVPQLETQEYAFGRNAKGEETSLWNCNKYPEFEAESACLPRVLN